MFTASFSGLDFSLCTELHASYWRRAYYFRKKNLVQCSYTETTAFTWVAQRLKLTLSYGQNWAGASGPLVHRNHCIHLGCPETETNSILRTELSRCLSMLSCTNSNRSSLQYVAIFYNIGLKTKSRISRVPTKSSPFKAAYLKIFHRLCSNLKVTVSHVLFPSSRRKGPEETLVIQGLRTDGTSGQGK
jgi:hypothetical protein